MDRIIHAGQSDDLRLLQAKLEENQMLNDKLAQIEGRIQVQEELDEKYQEWEMRINEKK